MRIILTGGGSGGHVIPFEPIIEALRAQHVTATKTLARRLDPERLDITFIGVADKKTHEFFRRHDVPTVSIVSGKIRRYLSWKNPVDVFFRLPIGLLQAAFHMWRIMPDVVISKGGYGSLPVSLAAVLYRIPVLLHESDAAPGATNALLVRFATAVAVGFETTKEYLDKWQYKTFVTGTPVRAQFTTISKKEGKQTFGLPANEPLLVVLGGSQGAQQINELLLKLLPELITEMAIIHITGPDHYEAVSTVAKELISHSGRKHLYQAWPYLTDTMAAALAAADGIVSRAGSTLAEISHLRTPTLLIPLEGAANDHQRKNAQAYEAAGAALVLEPTNLGGNIFKQNINRIMKDEALRKTLAENLEHLDFPRAGQNIASLAFQLAEGFAPEKK